MTIIRKDVLDKLPIEQQRTIQPATTRLINASGQPMDLVGKINIKIKISNMKLKAVCHVVTQLPHPIIIGIDFLREYNATIDLEHNRVIIGGKEICLTPEGVIQSFGRLTDDITVPPHTVMTCEIKTHRKLGLQLGDLVQVTSVDSGFFGNEPGIFLMNQVSQVYDNGKSNAMIINNTVRQVTMKRGNVVAMVEHIQEADIISSSHINNNHGVIEVNTINSDDKCVIHNDLATSRQIELIQTLIDANDDLFAKHDYDIGRTDLIEARIKLTDETPIRKKPYSVPLVLRDQVKKQIGDLVDNGIIRPSNSPWAFPMIVVRKKNNKLRLCQDFRALNQRTEKFYWPLGSIDDIFASLGGARYLSSLDMANAYHHIPMAPEDIPKTAFICEQGLFEYGTLPFGLTNAPSYYSQLMSIVLNGVENATAYLDDVLIWSKTFEDHLETLAVVFDRIRSAGLKLNRKKCEFFKNEMKYLGHLITTEGLKPDKDKIQVIQDLNPPINVKQVRSFMGMANFFRRYLPRLAEQARPLTRLTGKHAKFEWGPVEQKAFDDIKFTLTTPPTLKYPDPNREFELWCDASSESLGAVLIQRDENDVPHPVHYLSHQLSKQQQKWPIIERECFAIVFALRKMKTILWGRQFVIYSDHAPLSYIHSAQMKNAKVQRWALEISDYGGTVTHVQGKANSVADFLSRISSNMRGNEGSEPPKLSSVRNSTNDNECELIDTNERSNIVKTGVNVNKVDLNTVLDVPDELQVRKNLLCKHKDIHHLQRKDDKLMSIIAQLNEDPTKDNVSNYVLENDILYYVGDGDSLRLVVPSSIQSHVIREGHEGFLGAHLGARKTYNTLCTSYYFRGMYAQVLKYIQGCPQCQCVNLQKRQRPIQEPTMPKFPFETIAIDTCGPFPISTLGNSYVLTVVDMFTGYMECKCTPNKTAHEVATFLIDEIIPRHSCPVNLISDNGTEFCNRVIAHITKILSICHIRTSPFNPSANGRCERTHRVLRECLSKLVDRDERNWDQCIRSFVGAYNCAEHTNTGYSPFQLLYNRQPMYPMDTLLQDRERYHGEEIGPHMIEKLHKVFRIVRKNIAKQSEENRNRRNKGIKSESFNVGDAVYVYNNKRANKLQPRWLNGYVIVKKPSEFSFEVIDQLTQRTFKVHARNLRKAYPNEVWVKAHQPLKGPRKRRARYVMTPSDNVSSGSNSDDVTSSGPSGVNTDALRERLRRMRGHTVDNRPTDSMNSDAMRERWRRLKDDGDERVKEGQIRTLKSRPDPVWHPFPRQGPSNSGSSQQPSKTSPLGSSYRQVEQFSSLMSDSHEDNKVDKGLVKQSSSGEYTESGEEWENITLDKRKEMNKHVIKGGHRSTTDSEDISLSRVRDKLVMQDLQNQMAKLTTKDSLSQGETNKTTTESVGVELSQQPEDKTVSDQNIRARNDSVPSVKLSKIDGYWKVRDKPTRLSRVNGQWVRQSGDQVECIDRTDERLSSNSGIRESLGSKEDQGVFEGSDKTKDIRVLTNLKQRLDTLARKLKARKLQSRLSRGSDGENIGVTRQINSAWLWSHAYA